MTQSRFKVKKGDLVQVMVGKDKGRRGLVQKVFLDDAKVLVEGIDRVERNTRPSQSNPAGGKVEKFLPIHISNVSIVDTSVDKPGKIGVRKDSNGKPERFFKKSGNTVVRA